MSQKFSTSPALHLPIADSRRARCLQLSLFLFALAAPALIAREGRPELALFLLLPLFCALPRLVGQPWVGSVIDWRDGQWRLDRGCGAEPVDLADGCRVTPWAVLWCWQNSGGERGRLWMLPDAVPANEWRKLRVRLRLEC